MNDQNQDQNTCMACSCPCSMHKEHNHSTQGALCKKCDHEHKAGQKCDCGCK